MSAAVSPEVFFALLDPEVRLTRWRAGPETADGFFAAAATDPDLPCRAVVMTGPGGRETYLVDQVSQGRIFVDLDRGRVIKEVVGFAEFGLAAREAEWLTRLAGSGRSPQLLAAEGQRLAMTYRGEPLRQHLVPADWEDQVAEIGAVLARAGCAHNDIKCDNLVVLDGRLSLIDFGWATGRGDPVPAHWPRGIGAQHRLAVHRFDDAHALRAACLEAAAGRPRPSRRMLG